MSVDLPTADELKKLPLRAVVAYAARTARRVTAGLRGIVADDVLDDALRRIESVSTVPLISSIDQAALANAAAQVAAAYADASPPPKSLETFQMVFCLTHASLAAMSAVEATLGRLDVEHQVKSAVRAAERAIRTLKFLDRSAATSLAEAAREDYDILVEKYAKTQVGLIGDPIDCFDDQR